MYLGVDYYPEQWDKKMIDEDLDNIVELNCNIIRIGDFAWHLFEPQEGVYDFTFFDEVILKARQRNLKVMLCIPSATMPNWLYRKYPEIMNQDEDGHPQPFGARRGYCYNSPIYQEKVLALTKAMAMHYRDEKAIVAWQLDNEIGHEGSDMCYCENCHQQFIKYLQNKYTSINELNERWGNAFWTHCYDSFADIDLPRKAFVAQNPTFRLEWERFRSFSCVNFLKQMYDTLKTIIPDACILHDFEGGTLEKHFDPFEISKNLDEVAYNNYPVWGGTVEPLKPWEVALSLDAARGFKGQNFWITEEIMGAQGHDIIGCAIKPNQGSTWALQALAHGCKSFLVFRYRGNTKGAEQYCYGILDADNQKRRKFKEVQKLYQTIKENKQIFEQPIKTKVAMLFDYDSAASFRIQRQSDNFNYVSEMTKLYKQFYKRDMLVDIITKDTAFDKYEILVVPYMIVMPDEVKKRLKEFVKQGKTLICTNKLAWKDIDNNLVLNKRLPVDLTDLIGGVVEEQESLLGDQKRKIIDNINNIYEVEVFAEMLQATTAEVLYKYYQNAFGEYACVLHNKYGLGDCYYLGASLEEKVLDNLFDEITNKKIKDDLNEEKVVRNEYELTMNYQEFTYDIKKR